MLKTLREEVFVEIFGKMRKQRSLASSKFTYIEYSNSSRDFKLNHVKSDVSQEFNYLHTKILAANYALQRNVIIAKKIAFLIP